MSANEGNTPNENNLKSEATRGQQVRQRRKSAKYANRIGLQLPPFNQRIANLVRSMH